MKARKSVRILNKAFKGLQSRNPGFSVRALAKKAGVSHVFMAKILHGESNLPKHRLDAIARALQLDDLACAELKEALAEEVLGGSLSRSIRKAPAKNVSPTELFIEKGSDTYTAIEHWYELPILDLLTCEPESPTISHIARRLNLSEPEVASAIHRLKAAGLIEEKDGILVKAQKFIRFPRRIPHPVTRNYYRQVLGRASQELGKVSIEDYNRRSITNLCLAIDPDKLEIAKQKLQQFVYELSLELSEGEAKEVYFLATLLFPVTQKP